MTFEALIVPSFIAGILTFLAPCTLPLVPAYLAFISGVSADDLKNPARLPRAKFKIFLNGLFYVLGFSLVFVILGSLFGLGGAALIEYRIWLARIGGLFVILFGLNLVGIFKPTFLTSEKHLPLAQKLAPGNPWSAFIFGSTFAFGWTPCIGPILGSVLLLASTSATVGEGALLLSIFSLGLAIPFLAVALGIGRAASYLGRIERFLQPISFIGGLILIFFGFLLLTNNFGLWISYFYQLFNFINYDSLLKYL